MTYVSWPWLTRVVAPVHEVYVNLQSAAESNSLVTKVQKLLSCDVLLFQVAVTMQMWCMSAAATAQFCSGTAAPGLTMFDDHVWQTGVSDVEVVSQDGSPHGPKTFVLWNPPLLKPGRGGGGSGGGGNPLAGMPLMSRTEARARLKFNKWGWGSFLIPAPNTEGGGFELLCWCGFWMHLWQSCISHTREYPEQLDPPEEYHTSDSRVSEARGDVMSMR